MRKKDKAVTPHVMEGLIKLIKFQLSSNARLNQDTKVWNQIQRQRFQDLFSVDRLTQLGNFESLWESNQTLLFKANLSLMTCFTSVQI
jgi:hypothetical protein